jgi:hypothetical protein
MPCTGPPLLALKHQPAPRPLTLAAKWLVYFLLGGSRKIHFIRSIPPKALTDCIQLGAQGADGGPIASAGGRLRGPASDLPWLPDLAAEVARIAELLVPPSARVLEGDFPPVRETKFSLHDDNPSLLPMGRFPADGQEDGFPLKVHRRPSPSSTHSPMI